MIRKPILFLDFKPGMSLGSDVQRVTSDLLQNWNRLYGPRGEAVPAGLISVLLMRAYARVVTPRPSGNIHAGQSFRLIGRLSADDEVRIDFSCAEAFMKKEHRFVRFNAQGRAATSGAGIFDASMLILWAS